jgi:hypothetical protein
MGARVGAYTDPDRLIGFGRGRHDVVPGAEDECERPWLTDVPLSDVSPVGVVNLNDDHVAAGPTNPTGIGLAINRSR